VHQIDFQVCASAPDVIDQLAFVYLVQMKFSGRVNAAHPFWGALDGKKKKFLSVILQFRSFQPFDDAKYHCGRNLTDEGEVRAEYRGALDAADPRRLKAKQLHQRALAARSSN
jgi:hypothetical protein